MVIQDIPESQFINIQDPDKAIYRVFSINRLFEMFKNKKLTLLAPRLWEDPFENFLAKCPAWFVLSGLKGSLRGVFKNTFGQCWTYHKDSDAIWRIYSKENKGAKVRTTSRELLSAIYDLSSPFASMSYFIGEVQYLEENFIRSAFQNPSFGSSMVLDSTGRNQILSYLIKRKEFEHEAEVRLLFKYYKEGDDTELKTDVWSFDVDPLVLFDEVVFDPRVDDSQFNHYRDELVKLGYNNKIEKSPLYQIPNLTIRINA